MKKELIIDAGYIVDPNWQDTGLPTRRAYFDPDDELRHLSFREQLNWLAENATYGYEDPEDLADWWETREELDLWLDSELSVLDEGWASMPTHELARYSAYADGIVILEALGEQVAETLGLEMVYDGGMGHDFNAVRFVGDENVLNQALEKHGLDFVVSI